MSDGSTWKTTQGIVVLLDERYNLNLATPFGEFYFWLDVAHFEKDLESSVELSDDESQETAFRLLDETTRFFKLLREVGCLRYIGNGSYRECTNKPFSSDGQEAINAMLLSKVPRSCSEVSFSHNYSRGFNTSNERALFKISGMMKKQWQLPEPAINGRTGTPDEFCSAYEVYKRKFGTITLPQSVEQNQQQFVQYVAGKIKDRLECLKSDA